MRRKGFRFPIFWKIFCSCLLLAGLMIFAAYLWQQYYILHREGRGRFLEAPLKRYLQYQRGMSEAIYSTIAILAEDEKVRAALASDLEDKDKTAAAGARLKEIYDSVEAASGLKPDLFLVFDETGKPLFIPDRSPVTPGELPRLEMISRVKAGNEFSNRLVVHNGTTYVAAGVPIKALAKDDTIGGIVMGIQVDRFFAEYKSQSDDVEVKQLRLTLAHDDDVLASVFPKEEWDQLVESLHPQKRQQTRDGSDTIEIIAYANQTWDFYDQAVSGFTDSEQTSNLGTLYLMKTRMGMKRPAEFAFTAIIGILCAFVIAVLLAWWITRPLKTFITATDAISKGGGDLTQRIDVDSNDELGDLASNLNQLFEHLQSLAGEVQNASFQVGASSAEISAASKQMLEGAKDQALKIEGSTAAVTELSTSIQQVASNAIETTKVAKQSNEAVASAIESMTHIRRTVDDAGDKIRELGESGKRIGNIVEVIRQISEQTTLLALNASIEAAHAGEQGRGFAVVADEVSSLARRVGQSAKDIEDLIATIKDQTSEAVQTMQTGTREVESGTQLVSNTLGNLKQIIEVIQDTANAVQEQAIVSDEIARNMDAVQKIANEVLASSEEAVIQGEQLHNLAHTLEESVRGFKIEVELEAPPRASRLAARRRAENGKKEVAALPPAKESPAGAREKAQKAAAGGRAVRDVVPMRMADDDDDDDDGEES